MWPCPSWCGVILQIYQDMASMNSPTDQTSVAISCGGHIGSDWSMRQPGLLTGTVRLKSYLNAFTHFINATIAGTEEMVKFSSHFTAFDSSQRMKECLNGWRWHDSLNRAPDSVSEHLGSRPSWASERVSVPLFSLPLIVCLVYMDSELFKKGTASYVCSIQPVGTTVIIQIIAIVSLCFLQPKCNTVMLAFSALQVTLKWKINTHQV